MGNMDIYNKVKQPPKDAMKQINAGRLRGMSDINPQWRLEIMTEVFGPIGIGWKFSICNTWCERVVGDQVMAFAKVAVQYKHEGEWSDSLEGIGGSMLVVKESAGLHVNDEGYKMAITDAISTAVKPLGVGADVYRGRWDGSKYKDAPAEAPKSDKEVVNEYAQEAQKVFNNELSAEDMKTEMTEWFVAKYGADAMAKFSEMTNSAFSDPAKIKLPKNVKLAYDKFQTYKEGK